MSKVKAARSVVKKQTPAPLPVVHGNAGIQAWYRRQLERAVAEMHKSFVYWLSAAYKANGLAQDAADGGAATNLRLAVNKVGRRWEKVFDKLAETLPKSLADRILQHSDSALGNGLRGQGFMVKFTMSAPMNDAYRAVIGENVALIKSIASQHLTDVEGLVMRSVARGRDLGSLTSDLRKRYGITQRRAAFIARDQNAKATSVMQAARQKDIGITQGTWRHSHGGRTPRPSHLKADGKTFDLAKGMFLDGEWVMPGELPNCRCGWTPHITGFDD
jgi:SPP1 gp7 family putative phage head morphogenesis protein